jgi:hypothetical protein
MTLPSSAYLRALIATIDGHPSAPRSIRNECHRLMQAIDGNNVEQIRLSVARIEELAAEASLPLPDAANRD